MHTNSHAHTYTHMHVHTHTCMHASTYMRTHTRMHARTHTHAHTHTKFLEIQLFWHSHLCVTHMHAAVLDRCKTRHLRGKKLTRSCAKCKTSRRRRLISLSLVPDATKWRWTEPRSAKSTMLTTLSLVTTLIARWSRSLARPSWKWTTGRWKVRSSAHARTSLGKCSFTKRWAAWEPCCYIFSLLRVRLLSRGEGCNHCSAFCCSLAGFNGSSQIFMVRLNGSIEKCKWPSGLI